MYNFPGNWAYFLNISETKKIYRKYCVADESRFHEKLWQVRVEGVISETVGKVQEERLSLLSLPFLDLEITYFFGLEAHTHTVYLNENSL